MAMIAGKGGSATWAGTGGVGTEITSWSLDATADAIDVTNMASASDWREFLGGLKGWTASVEVNWDAGDTTMLGGLGVIGDLVLIMAGTTNLYGTAFCTGVSFSTPMEDKVTVTHTFQGSAALAYAAS